MTDEGLKIYNNRKIILFSNKKAQNNEPKPAARNSFTVINEIHEEDIELLIQEVLRINNDVYMLDATTAMHYIKYDK
jgi:hypothetical protein